MPERLKMIAATTNMRRGNAVYDLCEHMGWNIMHKHLHGVGFLLSTLVLGRIGPASRFEEVAEAAVEALGVMFAFDLS